MLFKEETFKQCSSFIVEFAVTFDDLIDHINNYNSDNYEHHMNLHQTLEELKMISPDHVTHLEKSSRIPHLYALKEKIEQDLILCYFHIKHHHLITCFIN